MLLSDQRDWRGQDAGVGRGCGAAAQALEGGWPHVDDRIPRGRRGDPHAAGL